MTTSNETHETLKQLVEINSIFPNEGRIGEFIFDRLKNIGFDVQKQHVGDNRFNIIGIHKPEGEIKRKIGFYGHMDTVPVQGNWTSDPFKFEVKEENGIRKGIGLGAYDMKAGLSAILSAIENTPAGVEVRVAVGVDEENNSVGASKLSEIGFFKGCDLVIVPEINDSPIQKEGVIMLGRRGRVRYEIEVYGQSCHGASGGGVNAINECSKIIQTLERMENAKSNNMEGSQFISSISAKAKSLSYPDKCVLELDVHLVEGETETSVLNRIRTLLSNTGVNFNVRVKERNVPYLMPYWTNKNNPEVMRLSNIVNEVVGGVEYSYGMSVADECIISEMAPVVSAGPIGGNFHRENEWVDLDSLDRLVHVFRKYLE